MKIANTIKKGTAILLSLLLILPMMAALMPALAEGDSTEWKEIRTIEDLYCIRYDMKSNYKLMNDLDLTEATAEGGDWDYDGRGWDPIGSEGIYSNTPFEGIFDGCGHTIKGMRINVTNVPNGTEDCIYVGLFSNVSGTVKNLIIENISVLCSGSNSNNYVGLIGFLSGSAINLHSSGVFHDKNRVTHQLYQSQINHTSYIGGICGSNTGVIDGCSNSADITAENTAFSYYTTYGGPYYECTQAYVGGIAGISEKGIITNCFNLGSFSKIRTNGSFNAYFGGISGQNGTISNCYNAGTSTMNVSICGIARQATISSSYNVGVTYGSAIGSGGNNNYYLSGTGDGSIGSISRTEAQMKMKSLFAGFDFDNVWFIDTESDYPYPQLRGNTHPTLSMLKWISLPTDTVYNIGETTLNVSGGLLQGITSTGNEVEIPLSSDMISGFDTSAEGIKTLTVSYGGRTLTYDIQVGEHTFTSVVTDPTCHSEGYTTYTCTGCGYTYNGNYTDVIPHKYNKKITAPTCTKGGYTEFICPDCGDHYIGDETAPKPHAFSPWQIVHSGLTTYVSRVCRDCGVTEKSDEYAKVTLSGGWIRTGSSAVFDLDLADNNGIAILSLKVIAGKGLTLTIAENGTVLTDLDYGINLLWSADDSSFVNGKLGTLTFTADENAPVGECEIQIIVNEACDADGHDLPVGAIGAKLNVIDFLWGDANGDGTVDSKDLSLLRKYMASYDYTTGTSTVAVQPGADANGDGNVDSKDLSLLRKYMASYDYTTGTSTVVLGPTK